MGQLVTVLMPVYNSSQYIEAAIESILKQTYSDFELLVIDDGSEDDTVSRLREYRDERIRLECLGRNGGIVSALNRGLEIAEGTYIARMDADDIANPNRLMRQVSHLEKNDSIGVCGTNFRPFVSEGDHMPDVQSWIRWFSPEDVRIALLFENPLCHPSVMMRANLLVGEGYSHEYPHAEEYDLWRRLADLCEVSNLEEELLEYRIHKNQVSQVMSAEQCRSIERIAIEQLERLGIVPTKDELRIHMVLGSAFYPKFGLKKSLEHWVDRLIRSNLEKGLFKPVLFEQQLHARLNRALARTSSMMKKMPLYQAIRWRLRSSLLGE